MTILGTERQFNFQWRDEQRSSRYPFADGCSLQTTEGLDLGVDTFLDGHLYPVGAAERLFLTAAIVDAASVTLQIGNGNEPNLAQSSFDPLAPPTAIHFQDALGRPAGVLIADDLSLSRFQSWDKKTHLFTVVDTEFAATVCCPMPEIGVRGFRTEDGDLVAGEVWLVGENGLVIREDPEQTIPGATILRVDIVGDPLFQRKLCLGRASNPGGDVDLFQTPRILKTINNKGPDAYGNFTLTVGRSVSLDPILRVDPFPERINVYLVGQLTERTP